MSGIDFFDVDHTIIKHSTGRQFVIFAASMGFLPKRYILKIPFYYLQYRLGFLSIPSLIAKFSTIEGRTRDDLLKLADDVFNTKIIHDIFPEVRERILNLKNQGRRVVLATSTVDLLVNPLAEHLEISDILASTLEFVDGKSTGCFEGELNFGREKKVKVLEFIKNQGADPKQCSFYSDSIHDLPLLKEVGRPVAVNPDMRLRRVAAKSGWEIFRAGT